MKLLFIGDIFGRPGRDTVRKVLPEVIDEFAPDIVIANAENLAHGNGITPESINEMRSAGVDFFTSGNHIWGNQAGVLKLEDPTFPVIRPANYPSANTPGEGYKIVEDGKGHRILVINLMGEVFMKQHIDSPFKTIDEILEETAKENVDAIIVDFHAETTAEKYAFGFYVDGRVSAVLGTHTHVSTTDARIFENGTAYISDVGMVGSYDSVIGVNKEVIIKKFLTQMPAKHTPETEGTMIFNAVILELDEETKKALDIKHIKKLI